MTDKTGAIRTRDADTPTTWLCLTCHFEVVDTVLPRKCPRCGASRVKFGEAAPAAFPVLVSIEGHDAALTVSVEGQSHTLSSVIGPGFRGISLEQPGSLEREYQIDGSDTTSTADRQL